MCVSMPMCVYVCVCVCVPHGSLVVIQLVSEVLVVWAVELGASDWILVCGRVGLGGGVEGGGHAGACLTTIVAVPVIHRTVRVLVCTGTYTIG